MASFLLPSFSRNATKTDEQIDFGSFGYYLTMPLPASTCTADLSTKAHGVSCHKNTHTRQDWVVERAMVEPEIDTVLPTFKQ